MRIKTVIFSDMDGTFLDEKYSYDRIKGIVENLKALGSSIVFCSSKTRKEIEFYRKAIELNEPFISENGAAVYIPTDYFSFSYASGKAENYTMIRLGTSYKILRNALEMIRRKTGAEIVGFGDMTLQELSQDTGLPLHLAKLAKQREHDEPFRIIRGDKTQVLTAITNEGLRCIEGGGRYFHLTGDHDKGKAASILKNLYIQEFGQVKTYAVGDGPNDLPMMQIVDKSFFIKKADACSRFNVWAAILRNVDSSITV